MSVDEPRPAGSCKHRPISNGWSQHIDLKTGESRSESWCGYCKASVEHDGEWRMVSDQATPMQSVAFSGLC